MMFTNPYRTQKVQKSALGFLSDNFEQGWLGGEWLEYDGVGDVPVSVETHGGEQKLRFALPIDSNHDMYPVPPIEACILTQEVNTGQDFDFRAKLSPTPDHADVDVENNRLLVGIIFWEVSTEQYICGEVLAWGDGTPHTNLYWRQDNGVSWSSSSYTPSGFTLPLSYVWLRLVKSGTTYTFYASDDGSTWEQVKQWTAATFLNSAHRLGVYTGNWCSIETNVEAHDGYLAEVKEMSDPNLS